MCRVSWDDCVQPSEKGVRVKGTAGLIAGAPRGLIRHCFPLHDLDTQSQGS